MPSIKDLVVSKVCGSRHSLWPLLFNLLDCISTKEVVLSGDGLPDLAEKQLLGSS